MKEGSEVARRVKAFGGEIAPAFFLKDAAIELVLPENVQALALCIIVGTG
jgi:hypothetical protein